MKNKRVKQPMLWLVALAIGVVNAIVFVVFEALVNEGTEYLWDSLLQTDIYRWIVIPLAVVMSVVLSCVYRLARKKRLATHTDPLEHPETVPDRLSDIGIALLIGFVSLLAGASLGPEASLMAGSASIGAWLAVRAKLQPMTKLLILASIGALLTAFLASPVMILMPLLLLFKQKQFTFVPVAITVLAGLGSYGTLLLIDHAHPGYGSIPASLQIAPHDFVAAFVVGFFATAVALFLKLAIKRLSTVAQHLNARMGWLLAAVLFGLVLGVTYLLGGESIQFSGSAGSGMLLEQQAQYGVLALLGLMVAKLFATAWSSATGYQGGVVFPSIYLGVALSLLLSHLMPGLEGPGLMIGGVAGILTAITASPVMSAIFVLSLLPPALFVVALPAVVGAGLGDQLLKRLSRQDR